MQRAVILVLDDEPNVLKAVQRALREEEFGEFVVSTTDQQEALWRLEADRPKVLITDFKMPGMDGVEVLEEARRISPETVRILMTGQAEKEQVVKAINSGQIYRFIAKPWSNTGLCEAVNEAVAVYDDALRRREAFALADRERRDLRAAVDIAGDIQRSILPAGEIVVRGADAACSFTPCEYATGDYVDVMTLPDGCSALLLGDVSGHGIGAALFVFTARALLRAGFADGRPLGHVVDRTNAFFCSDMDMEGGRFMTLFAAIFDPETRELTYVNGGQNPPVVLGPDGIEELTRTALPIGVSDQAPYETLGRRTLQSGETLFAYTDGVVEARNRDREVFGDRRLHQLLRVLSDEPLESMLSGVRRAVLDHVGDLEIGDDLALLALRPLEEEAPKGESPAPGIVVRSEVRQHE